MQETGKRVGGNKMKNNIYGVMVSVGVIGIEDGVKVVPADEDEMKRRG